MNPDQDFQDDDAAVFDLDWPTTLAVLAQTWLGAVAVAAVTAVVVATVRRIRRAVGA